MRKTRVVIRPLQRRDGKSRQLSVVPEDHVDQDDQGQRHGTEMKMK